MDSGRKKSRAAEGGAAGRTYERFIARPMVGQVLTILSGISFLFLTMLLPLVGPCGSRVEYWKQNLAAFSGVLALTLVLSGTAIVSKLERRKIDGSPLPRFSIVICGASVLILVALAAGLLKI